jgi:hypothetical protein
VERERGVGPGGYQQVQAGWEVVEQEGNRFVDDRGGDELVVVQYQGERPGNIGQVVDETGQDRLGDDRLGRIKQPLDVGFQARKGFLQCVLGPDIGPGYTGITFYNSMEYAAAVHEILTARHTTGTPKFIEWPLMRDLPMYPRAVLDRGLDIVAEAVYA